MSSDVDVAKKKAAEYACLREIEYIREADVVGLGTGSTIKLFINECITRGVFEGKILVASSFDTLIYVRSRMHNPVFLDIGVVDSIDIYIDGADEVSAHLDMIKGRGAAMTREKYLASIARRRIYIVDYSKFNGKNYLYKKPVPIEILPFALNHVIAEIVELGLGKPVLRMAVAKDGPVVTDNGGLIIDVAEYDEIADAEEYDAMLKSIHGVISTGLFPRKLVDIVYIGYPDRVVAHGNI